MGVYINENEFLPVSTSNTLKSYTAWGVDDAGWTELVDNLEKSSLSVIKASINFKAIEDDTELIIDLLTKRIQSQLFIPLMHLQGMQDQGELALSQYNDLIGIIKENQSENGITTDERQVGTPGLIVF